MRAALTATLLAASIVSSASHVAAHGREPSLGLVTFDPVDPEHIVVRTTWTLLESHDGGASWLWRCAVAVGYERTTEDPPIVIASDGSIMAGIFNGLVQSVDEGCRFVSNEDVDVHELYVIDLIPDPVDVHASWGVTSPGDQANTVVRSGDDGATWEVRGTPNPAVLLERVRVAPSDPMRVYASGAIPRRGEMERRALFFASSDGGRTYTETEIPLEGEERNLHVLAVDPTNPDRILMRVVRLVTDLVPERLLLSEDGGATWETAASLLEITGLVFSDDGSQVWVGGWDGAFLRSDAGGAVGTFAPVASNGERRIRCLGYRPGAAPGEGELWICIDDIRDEFALGRSTDGGETIDRIWGFSDARIDTGCPDCSPVGGICPTYWPDVVFDLSLPGATDGGTLDAGATPCDASIDAPFLDAGMMDVGRADAGPPAPPGSCGCRAGARSDAPLWVLAVSIALALASRRRR